MESEVLSVKLGIKGIYWDVKPEFSVSFNDQVLYQGTVTKASEEIEFLEFQIENNQEQGVLKVELLNKDADRDTIKDNYHLPEYTIVKDMLLEIDSLSVDDIDITNLIYTSSEYRPIYPVTYNPEVKHEVIMGYRTLGWNGAWSMTWGNPFYIWLLENL